MHDAQVDEPWPLWGVEKWNETLVSTVFRVAGVDELSPIYRIEATEDFLRRSVGANSDKAKAIYRAFVKAHTASLPEIKRRLTPDHVVRMWDQKREPPPFFSLLYLSLMVAASTEDTQAEGNFRKRMATTLGFSEHTDCIPAGFPGLWKLLEMWSRSQADTKMTVRPLVLPDPGREVIIGYAKRLSFPGYRDQVKLSRLMDKQDLTSESPAVDIMRELGRARADFSGLFQAEYDEVRALYEQGRLDAIRTTPLWVALERCSLGGDPGDSVRPRPVYALELDLADPNSPKLEILVRASSVGSPPPGWTIHQLAKRVGDLDAFLEPSVVTAAGETALELCLTSTAIPEFLEDGGLRRAYKQGCMAFAHDEAGDWARRQCLPSSGQAWLLLHNSAVTYVRGPLSRHVLDNHVDTAVAGGAWRLFGPVWCDKETAKLGSTPSLAGYDCFKAVVPKARIELRDALRLADGYLFLKPVLPVVVTAVGDRCEWASSGGTSGATEKGCLRADNSLDRKFDFDSASLARIKVPGRLVLHEIQESRGAHVLSSRDITVVGRCTERKAKRPSEPQAWLVESVVGQLAPIDSDGRPVDDPIENDGLRGGAVPSVSWRVARDPEPLPIALRVSRKALNRIPREWIDLLESLFARFSNRQSLDYDDVQSILRRGLDLQTGEQEFSVLENLIQNRFLQRLVRRRWRGEQYCACAPSVQFNGREGRKGTCMIYGLLSASIREDVDRLVVGMGLETEIAYMGDWEVLGPTRVANCDESAARQIGECLESPSVVVSTVDDTSEAYPPPWTILQVISPRIRLENQSIDPQWFDFQQQRFRPTATEDDGIALQSCRHEKEPRCFVLYLGRKPVWATRSKHWAVFVANALRGTASPRITHEGVVLTGWPAPLALADLCLPEVGVCGRAWRTPGSALWAYPMRDTGLADSVLRLWRRPNVDSLADRVDALSESTMLRPATDRWCDAAGVSLEKNSRENARQQMRSRYGMTRGQ